MTRVILQNIQEWRSKTAPRLCISEKSKHERALNIAICDQSKIRLEFISERYARKILEYSVLNLERKKEDSLNMHWNHYAINLIVKFTISIWADQCITSKEKFMDREYELLLHTCLSLLEEI